LYKQAQYHALFDINRGHGVGHAPYLLGDKRYSFINWIMMPYKEDGHHTIKELFYNIKTQMGPLCSKKCFWNSKNNFQGTILQIKIECGFVELKASAFHKEDLSTKFQHYAR